MTPFVLLAFAFASIIVGGTLAAFVYDRVEMHLPVGWLGPAPSVTTQRRGARPSEFTRSERRTPRFLLTATRARSMQAPRAKQPRSHGVPNDLTSHTGTLRRRPMLRTGARSAPVVPSRRTKAARRKRAVAVPTRRDEPVQPTLFL